MQAKFVKLTREQEAALGFRISAGHLAERALEENLSAQERADVESIQADGLAARNALVTANIRLAESRARRFQGGGRDADDLAADGYEALVIAADRFDPHKGTRFSTFAVAHIDRAIQKGIDGSGVIKAGAAQQKLRRRVNRESAYLAARGEKPSAQELADAVNLTAGKLADLATYDRRVASLDGAQAMAVTPCFSDDVVNRVVVEGFLNRMTPRERDVVTLAYGLAEDDARPKSLREVARILGLSHAHVLRTHDRALNRVRNSVLTPAA